MAEQGHAHAHDPSHDHDGEIALEEFTNTEMIVREDILAKTKELAELITTSDEVQIYRKAEQQIQDNTEVQSLISAIKKKQKEIVGFEYFKNDTMVKKIEGEIVELQDQLDSLPVVNQFQQTQSDINYLLQLIMSVIKDTVSEKINVESGTSAPPSSCG